jgi:hypothetical protein
MKCEDVEGLIIDYLDGKLDQKKASEIENHLETCERCLDVMKETQDLLLKISSEEPATPDESLRINFYHMLHNEIKKNEKMTTAGSPGFRLHWYDRTLYRIAAGIAILIAGTFFGTLFYSGITGSVQQREIEGLKSEVEVLRKTAMFTMLKDGSSSYRIQAVNYAEEINKPDENVIIALVKTLNGDKNVNVRMAAAYALSKYSGQSSVRDSLVKSLALQSDPILQVTLINILVELKEKSAIKPIERIISDGSTLKEVRSVAESGVKKLL